MPLQPANVSPQPANPVGLPPLTEGRRITRWAKGVWAGLVSGTLFLTVEMFLLEALGRGSMWEPLRRSAAIAMGPAVVEAPRAFTADIFVVGALLHYTVAICYAVILGMLIRKLQTPAALACGAGFGLLLYVAHFHGLTAFYPWVADARAWTTVVAHLAFGISAAWIYSHLHIRQLMRDQGLLAEPEVD
jgi:hypothetical protein